MGLVHKSIVEQVVEDLERRIVNSELAPGQRITEEALSSEYGVSRSSLREAFRILESQGYVVHEPRKGVSVTKITSDVVREVYQVRASLEGLAMNLAVRNISDAGITRLRKINEEMVLAVKEGDKEAYANLNQLFHESVIEASGNEFLVATLNPINKMAKRYRAEVFQDSQLWTMSKSSHDIIIELLENGDPEYAEARRRQTILEFSERIASIIRKKTDSSDDASRALDSHLNLYRYKTKE